MAIVHGKHPEAGRSGHCRIPTFSNPASSFKSRERGPMNHTFAEQTQVGGGILSSWTAQIPRRRPNVPLEHYVQMLEQELDTARTKIQENDSTIVHQANLLRVYQTSLVRNHNQNARAFAPYTHSSNPNYAPGFDRLQLPSPLETIPLPPTRLGTHPYLMFRPNTTQATPGHRDFAKRQRDWTDRSSEMARKRVRHNCMPTFTPSTDVGDASTNFHSNKPDWSVEYNAEVVDRTIEVDLIHTITDERGAFRIKFSPDGLLLAVVARWSQIVTIYNVATGVKICLLEDLYVREGSPNTYDLTFSPNGAHLATCTLSPENIIRIWEVGKKHVRNVLKGHFNGGIFCMHFSPDGRFLISGSDDKTVRIWNLRDGSSRIFNISSSYIRSVRFSPDGRRVAAGNWDGEVLIWDMPTGHLVASWKRHTAVVNSIVFTPNGKGLISGSWDRNLRYWDISGSRISDDKGHGVENLTFVGQTNRIRSISISADGRWLASSSNDHTVRIWNTHTGSQQCILQPHEGDVFSVDFSPTGGHFASASEDGQVRIWGYKRQCG